jgi:hypothetical protein
MDGEKNQKGKREILDKDVDEKKKVLVCDGIFPIYIK